MNKQSYKKYETNLEEMLFHAEVIICLLAAFMLFGSILIVHSLPLADIYKTILLIVCTVIFMVICTFAVEIEWLVGCYKCSKCGYYHCTSFSKVFWAPHIGRTRYLHCPNCDQKSWQKKVLTYVAREELEERNKPKEEAISVSFGERKQEEK